MKIDELIDRYFEGQTSCEEERELRSFFTKENVPEHLQVYRPLFACLEEEAEALRKERMEEEGSAEDSVLKERISEVSALKEGVSETSTPEESALRVLPRRRRFFYMLSGVAAGILLLFGIAGIKQYLHVTPEDYVLIDGKQYTDANLVREQALAAFRDVQTSEDEVLDLMFE